MWLELEVEGNNVHAEETNEVVLDAWFPLPKDGFMALQIY